ncbi:MAG: hypothetical protein V1725_04705 [archaeon]
MYGWVDDVNTWRNPKKYKFDSARKPYLDKLASDAAATGKLNRTYVNRSAPNSKLVTAKKDITSDSENPLIIAVDVTGSMASWPGEIFDRLPLLYKTLSQYKPDLEISFAAIGDATCDSYPLQINNFGKGVDLDDHIKALCAEGGGGGQHFESYELFGYHMLNHANVPKAKSPFLIMFGDESFYEQVDPAQVKHYVGDTLQNPLNSREMWQKLQQKFDVYMLHKPYSGGMEKEIVQQWSSVLGKQKVIQLYDEQRAVDVAMGLIAKKWGQYGDFSSNLSARHDDDDAISVHKSLRHVDPGTATKSVTHASKSAKVSKPLA